MHDDFFHLRDGFCFRRNDDGSITIQHREYGPGAFVVDAKTTVPPNEFASVMASVSARGEDAETFREAEEFLTRVEASVA